MPTTAFNARDLYVLRRGAWWLPGAGVLLLGACTGYVLPASGGAPSGSAGTGGPAGGMGGNSTMA
jgi:hypothetical protein